MDEGREPQKGGDICILMANSHCCMAETNKTLQKFEKKKIVHVLLSQ